MMIIFSGGIVVTKILIAEDDESVLEVLRLILSRENYQILTAKNGREAIDLYRFAKPELVLMDIELPEVDGITATKEIRSIDPNAKIIGVTAYARSKGDALTLAGALEIIEKPFSRRKIVSTIKKYLS